VDRRAWLDERRRVAEELFDASYAPIYREVGDPITPTHQWFVTRLLELCEPGGRILDAACGAGKYFSTLLNAGCRVVGVDQSAGMLAVARARHPEVPTEKAGLQELGYEAEFDAAICVDAMENICPEDWPVVLGNLRRAVRPGAPVYLTVETISERELAEAFDEAVEQGVPVVRGEHFRRGGGYHFYPSIPQAIAWLNGADLRVLEEGDSEGDNYGYHHLLAKA
jgi:SAM-dependent methyltransferase